MVSSPQYDQVKSPDPATVLTMAEAYFRPSLPYLCKMMGLHPSRGPGQTKQQNAHKKLELSLDSCFFLTLHTQYVRCLCLLALLSEYILNPTSFLHF